MKDLSEQQLVERAVGGDGAAFACLVEHNYALIFRVAFKWCGAREDAEDIAQDVCVKLGRAIKGFDARSAFSSWLYRITLNAVRDHQRGKQRETKRLDEFARDAAHAETPRADQNLERHELWSTVRRLPDKQRDAVLLIYGEERSHGEAAEIMGCAEKTVSWHIHKAKKTLKTLMSEKAL